MLIPFFLFMVESEHKLNIKALAEADRPREKLILHGRRHLSDAELIAILIRAGSTSETAVELSQRVLAKNSNSLYELGRASVKDLCAFYGMGKAKALSIVAALELGRRRKEIPVPESRQITCSKDAFEVLQPLLADLNHEEFWIMILNTANKVQHCVMISKGGRSGTVADPKVIFKIAVEHEAAFIILAHNHPSGNLTPSTDDIKITEKLMKAGRMMDLPVLDHLIIGGTSYCSMADDGYLNVK